MTTLTTRARAYLELADKWVSPTFRAVTLLDKEFVEAVPVAAAIITELMAEVEALRKDAERYHYIFDYECVSISEQKSQKFLQGDAMQAAIDAARAQRQQGSETK